MRKVNILHEMHTLQVRLGRSCFAFLFRAGGAMYDSRRIQIRVGGVGKIACVRRIALVAGGRLFR